MGEMNEPEILSESIAHHPQPLLSPEASEGYSNRPTMNVESELRKVRQILFWFIQLHGQVSLDTR